MITARNRRLVGWLACLALLFGVLAPLAAQGVGAALERSVAPWDDLCLSAAPRPGDPGPNSPAEPRVHGGTGTCALCTAGSTSTALTSHPLVFAFVPQPGALRPGDLPRSTLYPVVPPGTCQPRAPPAFA